MPGFISVMNFLSRQGWLKGQEHSEPVCLVYEHRMVTITLKHKQGG